MEASIPESATGPLTLVADIGGTNTRVALARGRNAHAPHRDPLPQFGVRGASAP